MTSASVDYIKWIDGTNVDDGGLDIITDNDNNVYVTGFIGGVGTGNPINIDGNTYNKPNKGESAFIVKYNSSKTFEWIKFIGGLGDDKGLGITVDNLGSVYATGYVDLSGTSIVINEVSYPKPSAFQGAYVIKFNGSGNLIWIRWIDGVGYEKGIDIKTDSNNNVYVMGITNSATIIIDGSTFFSDNNTTVTKTFIVKYNNSGSFLWFSYVLNNTISNYGIKMAINNNNDIYLIGYTGGIEYSPLNIKTYDNNNSLTTTPYNRTLNSSLGQNASYIIKFNGGNGISTWVKWIESVGNDYAQDIIAKNNNVYVTGYVTNTDLNGIIMIDGATYTKPYNANCTFIIKFSDDILSNVKWIGGVSNVFPSAITSDSNNNIYVAGSTTGNNINVDGNLYSKTNSSPDSFIIKYSSDDIAQAVQYIGGSGYDSISSITSDTLNNLYLTGAIEGTSGETIYIGNSGYTKPTANWSNPSCFVIKLIEIVGQPSNNPNTGGNSNTGGNTNPDGSINFRLPIELDSSGHIATLNAQGELVTYNAIDFAVQYDASGALSVSQLRNTIRYKENASDASKVDVTISGEVIHSLLETGLRSSSLRSFWDDALTGPAAIPLSKNSGEGAKYFQDSSNVAVNGSINGTMMANYLRRHVYNFIIGQVGPAAVSSGIGAAAELGVIAVDFSGDDASQIATKLVDKLVASGETGAFIRQSIYEQMLNLDVNRFVGAAGDHATGTSGEGGDSEYRQMPFAVNDSLSFLITFKFGNMTLGQSNDPFTGPRNDPVDYVSDSGKITVIDSDANLSGSGLSNLTAIFRVKFTN